LVLSTVWMTQPNPADEAGRWPATDMAAYDLPAMTAAYAAQVTVWASLMRRIGGAPGDLAHGYVHARLEPLQSVGIGQFTGDDLAIAGEALDAGKLLDRERLHVAIVGPAGRGKSALWRSLTRLAAQGAAGATLPVPIDWRDVVEEDVDDATALLRVTVQHVWPQCSPGERDLWAYHLGDRLRAGTAVALIDNWQRLRPLPRRRADRLRAALATWPRLVILGRYAPHPGDVVVQSFLLAHLNDQEIERFVRAWPAVTGRPLDHAAVVNQVTRSEMWRDLAREPWFLDLVCAAASEQPGQSPGLWALLNAALTAFVARETQGHAPGADVDLQAALAELAGSGYRRASPDQPVQRTFEPARVSERWCARWGTRGQQLLGLVYEGGLLRPADGADRLAFAHTALQAALAAEDWARRPDWLEHLDTVNGQPSWTDVIACAAARLGREGRLDELERLLRRLWASEEDDVRESLWLLAGRCLAELDAPTRRQLGWIGIGARLRQG